jgi:hypothetical protein
MDKNISVLTMNPEKANHSAQGDRYSLLTRPAD